MQKLNDVSRLPLIYPLLAPAQFHAGPDVAGGMALHADYPTGSMAARTR